MQELVEKRAELRKAFDRVMPDIQEFNNVYVGAGVMKLLKKILKYKMKYVRYLLARFGIYRSDVKVELFWGPTIKLPIHDAEVMPVFILKALPSSEYKLTRYLINSLQPNDVFYDVGANYGLYSGLAGEIISSGEIHAFEPNPEIFKYLIGGLGSKYKKISCVKKALSNQVDKLTFYVKRNSSGGSTLNGEVASTLKSNFDAINVPCITLDSYIKNHRLPTFMKLDVEGAEHFVIEGATELFKRTKPVISLEVWGAETGDRFSRKASEMPIKLGYAPHRINDNGELNEIESIDSMNLASNEVENVIFKAK